LFDLVVERMRVRAYDDWETGPFHGRCLQAASELGWPIASDLCDLDAGPSFGLETVNVVDGIRWNASFAYLDPVRDRIRILDRATIDRIAFAAGATTVVCERDGERLLIDAGTVVIAAGVYGSPGILERSGIGDPTVLRAVGVEVRHSLPGVGANLHDHPLVEVDRTVGPQLQAWLDEAAATGFLPEEQTLGKFVSSGSTDGLYDMHVFPVCASDQTSMLHGRVAVVVACLTPFSRGAVHVTSADHRVMPTIDHAYLADDRDLAVLRDGVVIAQQLLNHPTVAGLLGAAVTDVSSDDAIRRAVKHYYHPVGTCAMGDGAMAVCDADGRVRGVEGIVIADVSLMPQVPRANTNLPAVMIGERIARTLI
jgi:choline dehydrogenase